MSDGIGWPSIALEPQACSAVRGSTIVGIELLKVALQYGTAQWSMTKPVTVAVGGCQDHVLALETAEYGWPVVAAGERIAKRAGDTFKRSCLDQQVPGVGIKG